MEQLTTRCVGIYCGGQARNASTLSDKPFCCRMPASLVNRCRRHLHFRPQGPTFPPTRGGNFQAQAFQQPQAIRAIPSHIGSESASARITEGHKGSALDSGCSTISVTARRLSQVFNAHRTCGVFSQGFNAGRSFSRKQWHRQQAMHV